MRLITPEEHVCFPQTALNGSWQKRRIPGATLFSCVRRSHCLGSKLPLCPGVGRAEGLLAAGFLTRYALSRLLMAPFCLSKRCEELSRYSGQQPDPWGLSCLHWTGEKRMEGVWSIAILTLSPVFWDCQPQATLFSEESKQYSYPFPRQGKQVIKID